MESDFARHMAAMGRVPGLGGVAVNGHQGEVAALSRRERLRVIELARENLPKDKAVISGVLSPSIPDMAEQMKDARSAGADAALVIPPFDYMPRRILTRSWQAPYAFFAGLAERCDLPIVVFQYPHASGIWYSTEALTRIAEIDSVVGVKHAIRNLGIYAEQYDALKDRLSILAARDAPGLMTKMFIGADGACIGISNIAPEIWAEFTTDCLEHRFNEAREVFISRLLPLMQHCWAENAPRATTHSASTKEALRQLGVFGSSRVRPPEQNVNEAERADIRLGLELAGLLPQEQRRPSAARC
jgi:4-hydroxy-tetrahydrodipicolinate synthase